MKNNFLRYIFLSCLGLVLLSSCRKDEYATKETGNSGKSFIKLTEGKFRAQFFAPFSTVKPITMFTVRKTAANNADLQKANNIVLTDLGQDYVDQYNKDHDSDYELLPTSIYTRATDASIVTAGNKATFKFAPGDFAKNYTLNIDGSKFDPSVKYMVAFVISNSDGLTINAGKDTIISTVSLKNKYDGVYEVTGSMTDITNPAYGHINVLLEKNLDGFPPAPRQFELRTISATKCEVVDNYFYGNAHTIAFSTGGSGYSQYGNFSLVIEFDPATDKIANVTNYYGQPASNGRYAQLDPTGINTFDATSRVMEIKYNMVGGALVGANEVRSTWTETYTFKEERE